MSYEPTNWKSGDTVTSAKLNKIEQGIANAGVLVVTADNDGVLDHTWSEITTNWAILALSNGGYCMLAQAFGSEGSYGVVFVALGQTLVPYTFVASSADGYPVIQQQG